MPAPIDVKAGGVGFSIGHIKRGIEAARSAHGLRAASKGLSDIGE